MMDKNELITAASQAKRSSKETVAIFLDIDGVIFYNSMDGAVQQRVQERFKGKEQELPIPYPSIECDKAAVDLFSPRALHYLNKLILHINEEFKKEVIIILSSAWRTKGTIAFLKELFKQHFFANYLVDRTPELSCKPRSQEIAQWLYKNHNHYNLSNFIILDDCDQGLSREFPEQFVPCKHNKLFGEKEYKLALSVIDKILDSAALLITTCNNKD